MTGRAAHRILLDSSAWSLHELDPGRIWRGTSLVDRGRRRAWPEVCSLDRFPSTPRHARPNPRSPPVRARPSGRARHRAGATRRGHTFRTYRDAPCGGGFPAPIPRRRCRTGRRFELPHSDRRPSLCSTSPRGRPGPAASAHETVAHGDDDGLHPVVGLQLRVDPRQVAFDGFLAELERLGDLAGRLSGSEVLEHVLLTL